MPIIQLNIAFIPIFSSSTGLVGRLLGPLPMHPAAEDNYGYDACAILCLHCVPNVLVIATQSGMLYHCVVLEGDEEEYQMVRSGYMQLGFMISFSFLVH